MLSKHTYSGSGTLKQEQVLRERESHTHSCHEAIMNIKADWARDDNKLMIIPRSGYAGQTSNTHTTHEQEKVMS